MKNKIKSFVPVKKKVSSFRTKSGTFLIRLGNKIAGYGWNGDPFIMGVNSCSPHITRLIQRVGRIEQDRENLKITLSQIQAASEYFPQEGIADYLVKDGHNRVAHVCREALNK
jgi:hypothetical protein